MKLWIKSLESRSIRLKSVRPWYNNGLHLYLFVTSYPSLAGTQRDNHLVRVCGIVDWARLFRTYVALLVVFESVSLIVFRPHTVISLLLMCVKMSRDKDKITEFSEIVQVVSCFVRYQKLILLHEKCIQSIVVVRT